MYGGLKIMEFTTEELEELKNMLGQWLYEGFVSELTDVQKSILSKLNIEQDTGMY